MAVGLLLALEALVGLLSIVDPSRVVNRDLIACSRRVRAVTTSNDLSLDTHIEFWFCSKCLGKKSKRDEWSEDRGATLILIRNFRKVGEKAGAANDLRYDVQCLDFEWTSRNLLGISKIHSWIKASVAWSWQLKLVGFNIPSASSRETPARTWALFEIACKSSLKSLKMLKYAAKDGYLPARIDYRFIRILWHSISKYRAPSYCFWWLAALFSWSKANVIWEVQYINKRKCLVFSVVNLLGAKNIRYHLALSKGYPSRYSYRLYQRRVCISWFQSLTYRGVVVVYLFPFFRTCFSWLR